MNDFTLYLSEAAVKKLTDIAKTKSEKPFLRVEIIAGGCHGFNTKFSLDTNLEESDIVFNQQGVKFVSDEVSLEIINGSTIEHSSNLMGAYFWLNVKNAKNSCSCGSSFSVDMQ